MTTSEELLKNENVYNVPENLVFGVQQFLTDSVHTENQPRLNSSTEAKFFSTWCFIALKRPRKVKVTIIEKELQVKNCSKKSEKCNLRSRRA